MWHSADRYNRCVLPLHKESLLSFYVLLLLLFKNNIIFTNTIKSLSLVPREGLFECY